MINKNILEPIVYNSFYDFCEKVFYEAKIPKYNHKFSPKKYTNYYIIFLLVLKTQLKVSYRRLIDIVKYQRINRSIAYRFIPHYTTLQKASKRLDKNTFKNILFATLKVAKKYSGKLVIDGTGFSTINPSYYYMNRINAPKVKSFIKTSIIVDKETKLIINGDAHAKNQHDNLDFQPLFNEVLLLHNNILEILADKGYDSTKNFEFAKKHSIEIHIPIRNYPQAARGYNTISKPKPLIRKKALLSFDKKKYNKRSIVESINSAIKRKYSSYVLSRLPIQQEKEVILKLITYNLDRIISNFLNCLKKIIRVFYTALLMKN